MFWVASGASGQRQGNGEPKWPRQRRRAKRWREAGLKWARAWLRPNLLATTANARQRAGGFVRVRRSRPAGRCSCRATRTAPGRAATTTCSPATSATLAARTRARRRSYRSPDAAPRWNASLNVLRPPYPAASRSTWTSSVVRRRICGDCSKRSASSAGRVTSRRRTCRPIFAASGRSHDARSNRLAQPIRNRYSKKRGCRRLSRRRGANRFTDARYRGRVPHSMDRAAEAGRGLAGCFVLPGQGSLAALCGGVGSWRASGFAGVARLVSGGGRMKPRISLRKALSDKQLLADALPDESWAAWRILLHVALGAPIRNEQTARFK